MAKVTSSFGPLVEALRDALGIDPHMVQRVVIDIHAGHAPIIHIEQLGDEKLINVIRSLGGVEIERKDR